MSTEYIRNCVSGRLLCDTFVSTREILLRETNYDLRYLCEKYLNVNIPEIDASNLLGTFTSLDEIEQLLEITLNEAFYSMVLMDKYMILPLTKQLTTIAGNLWVKSLQGSRASRCEMLLLHEFYGKKYLLPDKYNKGVYDDMC
jgi:DNA polymerase alpha subunit A